MEDLALIEFPGVLRNPSEPEAALVALGGADAVREATRIPVSEYMPALSLNLRPGDAASRSNIGAERAVYVSNLFLLRVTRLPPETGSADDAVTEGERRGTIAGKVVGRVRSKIVFPGLSDFQHLDTKTLRAACANAGSEPRDCGSPVADNRERELDGGGSDAWKGAPYRVDLKAQPQSGHRRPRPSALPWREQSSEQIASETMMDVITDAEPTLDAAHAIDTLRPVRFVRSAVERGSNDYWFRQFGHEVGKAESSLDIRMSLLSGQTIGKDRRSDANRMDALLYTVNSDAEQVLDAPHEELVAAPVLRNRDVFNNLLSFLRERFQERPVWIRRAVLHGVSDELKKRFKRVGPLVGYNFVGSSPFYQAWIRYGYDPRKDPSARQYQVLEVRCTHPVVLCAIQEQHQALTAGHSEGERDPSSSWAANYTLSGVPSNKNLFVQVCDLEIDEVQKLNESEPIQDPFHPKTGFFTEDGHQRVLEEIKSALLEKAKEALGAERAQMIQDEYNVKSGMSHKKKKKKRLIALSEVIKPANELEVSQRITAAAAPPSDATATAQAASATPGEVAVPALPIASSATIVPAALATVATPATTASPALQVQEIVQKQSSAVASSLPLVPGAAQSDVILPDVFMSHVGMLRTTDEKTSSGVTQHQHQRSSPDARASEGQGEKNDQPASAEERGAEMEMDEEEPVTTNQASAHDAIADEGNAPEIVPATLRLGTESEDVQGFEIFGDDDEDDFDEDDDDDDEFDNEND